ncbi:hypothetical protein WDW37_11925 [Bdellovibrionota bacterium FG-1]
MARGRRKIGLSFQTLTIGARHFSTAECGLDEYGGSKLVWIDGKRFSAPAPELFATLNGNIVQQGLPPVFTRVQTVCYKGALRVTDEIGVKKTDCPGQADPVEFQELTPKTMSAAKNLLCKSAYSEKEWQLSFPNLRTFANSQITPPQAEALLLAFQKPDGLELSRDAEALVALLKSKSIRKTHAFEIGAILENVTAQNAPFYHDLLTDMPELLTAQALTKSPKKFNPPCRTDAEENRIRSTLSKSGSHIAEVFGDDAAQIIKAMGPLARPFGKGDSFDAQTFANNVAETLLKKSKTSLELALDAEHAKTFVSDWVRARLFRTPVPKRAEVFFAFGPHVSPVIIDSQLIDHNEKLQTPFGFYLKKLGALPISKEGLALAPPPQIVRWTQGKQVKTATLIAGADFEEKSEEAILDPAWKIIHGVYFYPNANDVMGRLRPGGEALAKKYHLTAAEVACIQGYTGSDYGRLNLALRVGGDERKGLDPYIAVLNRALMKLPKYKTVDVAAPSASPYSPPESGKDLGPVRRGARLPKEVLEQHQFGAIVTYQGYTSALLGFGFGGAQQFIIASNCGRNIEELSGLPAEREVLFLPGAKFVVLDRKETKSKYGAGNTIEFVMKEVGCE